MSLSIASRAEVNSGTGVAYRSFGRLRETTQGSEGKFCFMIVGVSWVNTDWMARVMIACVISVWSDNKSWFRRRRLRSRTMMILRYPRHLRLSL